MSNKNNHLGIIRTLPSHKGFSLIELIVVIGIIGVVIGLLIQGVQRVREAANRATCANNLKQIGLAFQTHQTALGYFPTAGEYWGTPPTFVNGVPAVGKEQEAGWGYQVLPYLESDSVWRGGDETTDYTRQRFIVGVLNPVFFCPTRRAPMTLTYWDNYLSKDKNDQVTHALCDYASNNLDEDSGVIRAIGYGPPLKISDVTDGTSTTLMIGEKRLNLFFLGTNRRDDNEGYTAGNDWDTMRDANVAPGPDVREETNEPGFLEFGSSHPGGFNIVCADGAVHFISFSIDPKVFSLLGTRADGKTVALGDF